MVKGIGFGLCAHRIEEGNEFVSDPKETECLSPVHDKLAKGQEVLGKESESFQSQDLSSMCRIGWHMYALQMTQATPEGPT